MPATGEITPVPPPTGGPDPKPLLSQPRATTIGRSAGPARKAPLGSTASRDSIPSNPTPASITAATGLLIHTARGPTSIQTITASDPWRSRRNRMYRHSTRTGARTAMQCRAIRSRDTGLLRRNNPDRPRRRPIPPDLLTPIIRGKSTTFGPWRNRPGPGGAGKDHTDNPIGTRIHIPWTHGRRHHPPSGDRRRRLSVCTPVSLETPTVGGPHGKVGPLTETRPGPYRRAAGPRRSALHVDAISGNAK